MFTWREYTAKAFLHPVYGVKKPQVRNVEKGNGNKVQLSKGWVAFRSLTHNTAVTSVTWTVGRRIATTVFQL